MAIQSLSSHNIVKRYAGVLALADGNLKVHSGEVVALVGSNGSGKSTLCKIITGVVAPNGGRLLLDDQPVSFNEPYEALKHGIAAVYQELSLIPTLTVAQNIWLFHEPVKAGIAVDRQLAYKQTQQLIDLFKDTVKTTLTPNSLVKDLPPDERQIVEILKAISHNPDVMILDEATSSLDNRQVNRLFELVLQWKNQGKAIIFISHRLSEVFRIADRVIIFRNGSTVGDFERDELDEKKLIRLIVGEEVSSLEEMFEESKNSEMLDHRQVVLKLENLSTSIIDDVSLNLKRGELLGIGGLQGQGQPHVLLAVFGAVPYIGQITLNGQPKKFTHPSQAMKEGLALIPGDRANEGLLMRSSIFENLELPSWEHYGRILRIKQARQDALNTSKSLSIKMESLDMLVSSLSGGNAQKVVIGKWLQRNPSILLLNDPTKGVDIGAKGEFYNLLHQLQEQGASIIFYSSDDEELIHLCDRVLVMYDGRIKTELTGENLTLPRLIAASLSTE
jgi:ribose transport system ATP-binding protein